MPQLTPREERAAASLHRAMTLYNFVAVCNGLGRKPVQVLNNLGEILCSAEQANAPIADARETRAAYSKVTDLLTTHILRAQLGAPQQVEEAIADD